MIFLFWAAVFVLCIKVVIDTDFGWHLRIGEIIFNSKIIPKNDVFSFSLPNYPYVYHSWLGELLIYVSYKLGALWGVTLFFGGILFLSSIFIFRACKVFTKDVNPLLFLGSVLLFQALVGGRMREFGLLFLSIEYFLFLKFRISKSRLIWLIPAVFALWVNFHGSFVLGLAVYFLCIGLAFLFEGIAKKDLKLILTVGVLSIFATFVNPYGVGVWTQALTIFANSVFRLRAINSDWRSISEMGLYGIFLSLVVIGFLLSGFWAQKKRPEIVLNFIFLLLTVFIVRFAFALLVFFVPFTNFMVFKIKRLIDRKILSAFSIKFAVWASVFALILLGVVNVIETNQAYKDQKSYSDLINSKFEGKLGYSLWPYEAGERLTEGKRILADANSANFLILQNPNLRFFYFGPMDNYFWKGQPFIFEYRKLLNLENSWKETLNQWQIETVILPADFKLAKELSGDFNWKQEYADGETIIFTRN